MGFSQPILCPRTGLLLSLVISRSVSAAVVSYSSNAVCLSGWQWADTSSGSDPCLAMAQLRAACTASDYTLPRLQEGYHYASNGDCTCNMVVYNLASACSACQGVPYITFDSWAAPCNPFTVDGYPFQLPPGLDIPIWAFQRSDLNNRRGWNQTLAYETAVRQTLTDSSKTASKGLSAGAIGGIVGGVIGVAFLIILFLWVRKTRQDNGQKWSGRNIGSDKGKSIDHKKSKTSVSTVDYLGPLMAFDTKFDTSPVQLRNISSTNSFRASGGLAPTPANFKNSYPGQSTNPTPSPRGSPQPLFNPLSPNTFQQPNGGVPFSPAQSNVPSLKNSVRTGHSGTSSSSSKHSGYSFNRQPPSVTSLRQQVQHPTYDPSKYKAYQNVMYNSPTTNPFNALPSEPPTQLNSPFGDPTSPSNYHDPFENGSIIKTQTATRQYIGGGTSVVSGYASASPIVTHSIMERLPPIPSKDPGRAPKEVGSSHHLTPNRVPVLPQSAVGSIGSNWTRSKHAMVGPQGSISSRGHSSSEGLSPNSIEAKRTRNPTPPPPVPPLPSRGSFRGVAELY